MRMLRSWNSKAALFLPFISVCVAAGQSIQDFSKVPGIVIDHSPASSGQYLGSPSIAVLPNGNYLAKYDLFGPLEPKPTLTRVFGSRDRGKTWSRISEVQGMAWASIFVHRGQVYMMGTSEYNGYTIIRKSTDGGKTWTQPKNKNCGLLLDNGKYHCAPVPMAIHRGRIWRGMENTHGPGGWAQYFQAFMMSAPLGADLLKADSWTCTNPLGHNPEWLGGKFGGWLEGNAVVTPDGHIVDILRVDYRPEGETAAMIRISDDGKIATFDPQTGFIRFPGGAVKFTIRRDPKTKFYWSLSNPIPPQHSGPDPGRIRNTLALIRSHDLRNWSVRCIIAYHPDREKHGFQYVDWLFEGNDIIAVCRTAHEDGLGGAHNMHDANFVTFHRIKNFRQLTMNNSVPMSPE
jgi:hypothetical protein